MKPYIKVFLVSYALLASSQVSVLAQSPAGIQTTPQQVYTYPTDQGAGGWNFPGVLVGTSSVQVLPGGIASHAAIQNTSAAATVACAWGATPALNSPGSFQLSPGQIRDYGAMTTNVPPVALNCIASAASTPVYAERH